MTKKQPAITVVDYKLREVFKSTFIFERSKDSMIVDNQPQTLMIEFEDIKIIMKSKRSQIKTVNLLKEALSLIVSKRSKND